MKTRPPEVNMKRTCIGYDTLVQVERGICERVLPATRKAYARAKAHDEVGKSARGTHGVPVSFWVIEEQSGKRRKIWQDGKPVSGRWTPNYRFPPAKSRRTKATTALERGRRKHRRSR